MRLWAWVMFAIACFWGFGGEYEFQMRDLVMAVFFMAVAIADDTAAIRKALER